jgi:DNA modification methylase
MRQLKIEYLETDKLIPYINNPRINDNAVDAVAGSIAEFGFKNPIIVDRNNVIIAGHTRLLAARKLGLDQVPVIRAEDLTEKQVKAFRIADNKTAELSEWDDELLAMELEGLEDMFTGFSDDEIDALLNQDGPAGVIEDDFEVVLPEEPKAKPGDIYQLGKHRLMCGDSTKPEDVQKLMDGELADMVFTDPPYNVNYGDKAAMLDKYQKGHRNTNHILNDNMGDSEFREFLLASYSRMFESCKEGAPIYVCHAETEGENFRGAFVEAGFKLAQCIIWVKNSLVLGRQDYHWRHEPILYGWKPGAAHKWYGGRKQDTVIEDSKFVTITEAGDGFNIHIDDGVDTVVFKVPSYEIEYAADDFGTTVWRVDRPSRNVEHPTMKPIELVARAIRNSSKKGNIVLDTFGGSGSTLIACEQLDRACYTMELDPVYVDVIIERWEQFTGQKAVLL